MDLQKRTAIAVGLSVLIVVIYSLIVPKVYHIENKEVTANITHASTSYPAQSAAPEKSVEPAKQEQLPKYEPIIFIKDNVIFEFSPFGATLVRASFPKYKYEVSSKTLLGTDKWSDLKFSHKISNNGVFFKYQDSQKEIIKEYKYNKDYYVELSITYRNLTSSSAKVSYSIITEFTPLTQILESFKETLVMGNDGILLRNNTLRIKKGTSLSFSQVKWYGLRDKYFAYLISPIAQQPLGLSLGRNTEGDDLLTLGMPDKDVAPGASIVDSFTYYCGPQQANTLSQAGIGFENVRYFGKLDGLAKFLLKCLVFVRDRLNSWGLAIIILTIITFVVLYPLTMKQMHSMKKMQVLQPEIEAIRKKYKDEPQKLNKEVMELYRKHNANPLGGCLPIILQIPIFFALYQALNRGIELKGASFLWIKDLSEPDRIFNISGKDINLLPILMMATMFFQQKLSMKSMSSAQAEQQKMMLWIMPIMFGFIFYNMPSGLVLYWFVNSILMTLSQWKALK